MDSIVAQAALDQIDASDQHPFGVMRYDPHDAALLSGPGGVAILSHRAPRWWRVFVLFDWSQC